MRACIILQNQYHKVGHAIALHLKEHHNIDEFCAYIFSPGAHNFIERQKDIHYAPILIDHELQAQSFNKKLDIEFIKQFEQTYSPPPLWHYLYSDRKLMMSIGPKEESTTVIDPLYTHEELMATFQTRARAIEKMLRETRPDFILFFAIGSLSHMILYHVAKKLGIRTFNIDFPRISNRICISEDYQCITGIDQIAYEFSKENADATPFHVEAHAFTKSYLKTGLLHLEYYENFVKNFISKSPLLNIKSAISSLRYIKILTGNYLRNRHLFLYGETDQNPLRFIQYKLTRRYRALRGLKDLYSDCTPNESYAYYPLHFEPEMATLLLSPYYFNQIELIKSIARSLPLHYKLYVKEHPAMKNRRPRSYYRQLLKLPNVKLINPETKSFDLIRGAKLITTITGTVGWEACLLGKPVITFGEVFYNSLSGVRRIHDIEQLPFTINDLLDNYTHNETEVTNFLAAAFKDSFPFDFHQLWYQNDITILKDHPQIADFCKHLIKKVED